MSDRIIEEVEAIVAGEMLAMQINPSFADWCVLTTYRVSRLTSTFQDLVAQCEEALRGLSGELGVTDV